MVLEQNVIVATIQYRLGFFGFGMIPEKEENYQANWGLLDQSAAIQWLSKFMTHFGGDVENSNLLGCSAGGGSVIWHQQIQSSWEEKFFKFEKLRIRDQK